MGASPFLSIWGCHGRGKGQTVMNDLDTPRERIPYRRWKSKEILSHTHIYIYILEMESGLLRSHDNPFSGPEELQWLDGADVLCHISSNIFWEDTHDRSLQVCFTSVWHHEKETEPRVWRLNNHQES